MYEEFAVNNITNRISEVMKVKLNEYVTEKRNSEEIKNKINESVDKINKTIVTLDELVFNGLEIDVISIDGLDYKYNKEEKSFELYEHSNIEQIAEQRVYGEENLNVYWMQIDKLNTYIRAIISTLEPTSLIEIEEIVEAQINFDEILKN